LVERIRAFVSIHLASEPFDEVVRCIEALKSELADLPIKWIRPEQVHLTLAFLGSVDADSLPELKEALERAALHSFVKPFDLHLQGIGRFGHAGRGQVLWMGLEGELGQLSMLSSVVDAACAPFTARRERRTFNPHVTIARCEKLPLEDFERVKGLLHRVFVRTMSWKVESFQLMRSHLKPTGAEYEILESFVLGSK
jgi:2'-5' RNA ligase